MYDELYKAMLDAHTVTKWFSFGEAMTVTSRIDAVCQAYRKNPDKAKESLFEIAKEVSRILRRQNTKEAKFASENLEIHLTTIKMEG